MSAIGRPQDPMEDRRLALVEYLRSCVDQGDWHGVRDAAVDLEVVEGRMAMRAALRRGDDSML